MGELRGANPAKQRLWQGKALWQREAAMMLFQDAAETYDRYCREQERARKNRQEQHMRIENETRFTAQQNGQLHATTVVFQPDPACELSDEEILDMDWESADDAFPTRILIDMIDAMMTCLLYTSPSPRD